MAQTSTYLNFERESEEAFNFYKSVFGTEFVNGIMRFGDIPVAEGDPPMSEEDKNLVMNVQLPIVGGHLLMATDAPKSMGFNLNKGNNIYIAIRPDSRDEADALFAALLDGGTVQMAMQDQFWGDYFGSLVDKFGVQWMVSCSIDAT
jgi:PhnB protein